LSDQQTSFTKCKAQPVAAPAAGVSAHARSTAAAAMAFASFQRQPEAHQDFRRLKAAGYKPPWFPDALHTKTQAALWLNGDGTLQRWQQVSRAGSRSVELIQLKLRCENQQGGCCVTFAQPKAALTSTD